MTAFLLTAALLVGPLPEPPTLQLRLHLGTDHQSRVIESELRNRDQWFVEHRLNVERHFRIMIDHDARLFPTYQIGYGGDRERFRPGTFIGSGTFLLALESLAEIDAWEREFPESIWRIDEETHEYGAVRDRRTRPESFPPEVREP